MGHGFHSVHWVIVANSLSSIWSVTQEVKSYMSLPSLGSHGQSWSVMWTEISRHFCDAQLFVRSKK